MVPVTCIRSPSCAHGCQIVSNYGTVIQYVTTMVTEFQVLSAVCTCSVGHNSMGTRLLLAMIQVENTEMTSKFVDRLSHGHSCKYWPTG